MSYCYSRYTYKIINSREDPIERVVLCFEYIDLRKQIIKDRYEYYDIDQLTPYDLFIKDPIINRLYEIADKAAKEIMEKNYDLQFFRDTGRMSWNMLTPEQQKQKIKKMCEAKKNICLKKRQQNSVNAENKN